MWGAACCDTRCNRVLYEGNPCDSPGYACTFWGDYGGCTSACGSDLVVHCVSGPCCAFDMSLPGDLSSSD
jgi:hypothetical protein